MNAVKKGVASFIAAVLCMTVLPLSALAMEHDPDNWEYNPSRLDEATLAESVEYMLDDEVMLRYIIHDGVLLGHEFLVEGSKIYSHSWEDREYWNAHWNGEIVIPDSVTAIADNAFGAGAYEWGEDISDRRIGGAMRDYIKSVTIPDSVTTIGDSAFYYCQNLESVTIPNSVTSIGKGAFSYCYSLKSVTIPDSVTTMGEGVFWVGEQARTKSQLTSVTLGSGLTSIPDYTFGNCENLPGITIPDTITAIGERAFSRCLKLTSAPLPDSVQSIGDYAFAETKLTDVTIPDGVTRLGSEVFGTMSLTSLTIPDSVTEIDDRALFHWLYGASPNLVIHGGVGSAAEAYADKFEIAFVPTGGGTPPPPSIGPATPPAPAKPSSWAEGAVNAAIAADLVPQELQIQYTQAATRAEFCALSVALYETATGAEIAGRTAFTDTLDENVQKMAFLGVVSGVGGGRFDPEGRLTREQAAAMLARLAEAMGKPLPAAAPTFSDNAAVASWAFDAVGRVQASGIMGGVGKNAFAPQGEYTREQSILTMYRLFEMVK